MTGRLTREADCSGRRRGHGQGRGSRAADERGRRSRARSGTGQGRDTDRQLRSEQEREGAKMRVGRERSDFGIVYGQPLGGTTVIIRSHNRDKVPDTIPAGNSLSRR
jgi:hypothetical protein